MPISLTVSFNRPETAQSVGPSFPVNLWSLYFDQLRLTRMRAHILIHPLLKSVFQETNTPMRCPALLMTIYSDKPLNCINWKCKSDRLWSSRYRNGMGDGWLSMGRLCLEQAWLFETLTAHAAPITRTFEVLHKFRLSFNFSRVREDREEASSCTPRKLLFFRTNFNLSTEVKQTKWKLNHSK